MSLKRWFFKYITRYASKGLDSGKSEGQFDVPYTRTRLILAFLGVAPCSFKPPYLPSMDVTRSNVLYSFVVYSMFSCNFVFSIKMLKDQYDEIDPSEHLLRAVKVVYILIILTHVLGLVQWFDTYNYKNTLEIFLKLQVDFKKATGKVLKNHRRKMEHLMIVFATVILPFYSWLTWLFVPIFRINISLAIAFVYGTVVGVLIGFYWVGISLRLSDAVDDVMMELKQALMSSEVTPTMVYDLRRVWLSIRSSMDSMSKYYNVFGGYILILFVLIVLFFEVAMSFVWGDMYATFGATFTGFWFISSVGLCYLASHHVENKVLMFFFVERARPAVTTFDGVAMVNKQTILSMFVNWVNWMLIIAQFSNGAENFIIY